MIRKTSKSRHLRRQLSPTLNVLLEYEPIIETLERKRDRAPQNDKSKNFFTKKSNLFFTTNQTNIPINPFSYNFYH